MYCQGMHTVIEFGLQQPINPSMAGDAGLRGKLIGHCDNFKVTFSAVGHAVIAAFVKNLQVHEIYAVSQRNFYSLRSHHFGVSILGALILCIAQLIVEVNHDNADIVAPALVQSVFNELFCRNRYIVMIQRLRNLIFGYEVR